MFNPCETRDGNFKVISITQAELQALQFSICMEKCINKDAKKKEKRGHCI